MNLGFQAVDQDSFPDSVHDLLPEAPVGVRINTFSFSLPLDTRSLQLLSGRGPWE